MAKGQVHALIGHQNIGDTFQGTYYVESVYIKQTVQKKDYSDFTLRDKSGPRNVKFWGVVQDVAKGDFVFISAGVDDYQGNPSIVAKNVEKADTPTDLSDYIPVYDDSDKQATRFDEIRAELKAVETKTGDDLPGTIVDEVYGNSGFFQKFVLAPGSAASHYGKEGGLLANTVRLADAAIMNASHYNLTDSEKAVLIASALLCRIGAIDAYSFIDCMPTETKRGALLGMNNLTLGRVQSALRRALASFKKAKKAVSQDTVLRILHAVSSIDGQCVTPMTKEALVLHSAYVTDTDMVEAIDFIETDINEDDEFTAWDPAMKRRYYTG
jgi:23S rRNA maturation-related 3'-5' exoribonuclease YhaM